MLLKKVNSGYDLHKELCSCTAEFMVHSHPLTPRSSHLNHLSFRNMNFFIFFPQRYFPHLGSTTPYGKCIWYSNILFMSFLSKGGNKACYKRPCCDLTSDKAGDVLIFYFIFLYIWTWYISAQICLHKASCRKNQLNSVVAVLHSIYKLIPNLKIT